jgi:hypothetical protein
VSNVFHTLPHAQNHLSSFRGDQPQSGQRMRSESLDFFSSSSSRSNTEAQGSRITAESCPARLLAVALDLAEPQAWMRMHSLSVASESLPLYVPLLVAF